MRLPRNVTALAVLATLAAFTTLPALPAYADAGTETYIVQLKSGVAAEQVVPQLLGKDAEVVDKVFQGGIADLSGAEAAALAKNPLVSSVQKDPVITATATQLIAPWDLDELDSRTAAIDGSYTYPNDGSGVTVYVLDTGIQRTHTQFSGAKIAAGYDFVDNDTDPSDCNGHGTAVSSLVAGSTVGAAKGVTLVPLRVLDCLGNGTGSNVIRAAQWIAANRVPGSPAVANLSFGGPGGLFPGSSSEDVALQSLINAGVNVVAAAGNDGASACTSDPASLPDAITVAAVDRLHAEPSWSNHGSCVDLYAPGDSVTIAWTGATNSTIRTGSGTSFAAPLTAAAVALILHDHPTWTPAQVRAELMGRALSGLVTGPGGLPARSANKLLHVGSERLVGTDPTITGAPFVGMTLSATPHWSPTPTTLAYQWKRNGVPIGAATEATYVVTGADLGQSIMVTVTGSRSGYDDVTGASVDVRPASTPVPGMVVTMTPSRLMDTRIGLGATGPLYSGQTVKIPVAGVGSIMASTSAVLVNITVTDATSSGFVTAYASGGAKPATSNANFTAGNTSANLALVPVGADGAIALTVSAVSVSLVVDVQSYVAGGVETDAGAVVPMAPARLWDTRQHRSVGPNELLNVQVTGIAGVPSGATAVFLNVTVTEPQANGHLTVFPAGEARPATSNINFVTNLTVPNMALVKVGANGSISILNANPGTVHIVVDIQGYITAGTPTTAGAVVPVSPIRVVDTRLGLGAQGPVAASSGVVVTISGQSFPTGTTGVFMNLTVTEPKAGGWVAAYPTQGSLPLVSNVNFVGGQTVPNLATVGLANAEATLHNGSGATVQLVADVFAYIL